MILIVAGGVVAYTYKEEMISTYKLNMKDNMSHYKPGSTDDDTVVWDAIQQGVRINKSYNLIDKCVIKQREKSGIIISLHYWDCL